MIAFQPNGLINGLLLGASPSMTTSSTNRIRSASRQSSSASANRLATNSAAAKYACIERFINGLVCHAGSLNRLSGLAGARSRCTRRDRGELAPERPHPFGDDAWAAGQIQAEPAPRCVWHHPACDAERRTGAVANHAV